MEMRCYLWTQGRFFNCSPLKKCQTLQTLFRWDLLCNLTLLGEEQLKKTTLYDIHRWRINIDAESLKNVQNIQVLDLQNFRSNSSFSVCPQTSVLWEMLFDNNRESREVRTCWVHTFQRISNQFFSSRSQFKFPNDFVLKSSLNWIITDFKLDCLFLNFYHFFTSLLTSSSL